MSGPVAQATLLGGAVGATVLASLRWLRVAQREHYLPGSVSRFARRWWSTGPNRLLGAAAVIGLLGAAAHLVPAGLVAVAAVAAGPVGLRLRGRTSALVWTRRLRVLAAATAAVVAGTVGAGVAIAPGWPAAATGATLVAVATPLIVDLALLVTGPLERHVSNKFVRRAAAKLASIHPQVVAITGSFGKTTTKGYVAHLISGTLSVVATPKSYNNQSGLSRAVNEHLLAGTDVFVAEMGTYGPGEIAQMCSWVTPDIAVITAIGPVHLERMKSEAIITEAKAEILARAPVSVLNVDSEWLAPLAVSCAAGGRKVWRCSAVDRQADVCVVANDGVQRVFVRAADGSSRQIAALAGVDAAPTNVACAVAVALELGVSADAVASRLPTLPVAPHRREVAVGLGGATVIDDTYNANPAGAAAALHLLAGTDGGGSAHRRVLVTPGMVELGTRQDHENMLFGEEGAAVATDMLVVGKSNAKALVAGWRRRPEQARARLIRMATREDAVRWVARNLGPGDVVLYENDLPDHYP